MKAERARLGLEAPGRDFKPRVDGVLVEELELDVVYDVIAFGNPDAPNGLVEQRLPTAEAAGKALERLEAQVASADWRGPRLTFDVVETHAPVVAEED